MRDNERRRLKVANDGGKEEAEGANDGCKEKSSPKADAGKVEDGGKITGEDGSPAASWSDGISKITVEVPAGSHISFTVHNKNA